MRAVILQLLTGLLLTACSLGVATNDRRMLANGHAISAADDGSYDEGKRQLLAGNYGLAVQQLRATLRTRPRSPEVLNALAVAYEHLGRHDVAQGYFVQALAADPNSVQTLNNIARSLMNGGSVALAKSYLERGAALEPDNPVVSENLLSIAAATDVRAESRPRPALAGGSGWIERTSPTVQTIVTRESPVDDGLVEPDETLLPLLSFAEVEFDGAVMEAKVMLASMRSAPAARPSVTVRDARLAIANGNGQNGMAARVDRQLQGQGWKPARLLNAEHFGYGTTVVAYRRGFADAARDLAKALPIATDLKESRDLDVDLLLRIGKDLIPHDAWTLR